MSYGVYILYIEQNRCYITIQEKKYFISEIYEHDKPLIEIGNKRSSSTNGNFMLSFVNKLDIATLIAIENNQDSKLKWKSDIAIDFNCWFHDKR